VFNALYMALRITQRYATIVITGTSPVNTLRDIKGTLYVHKLMEGKIVCKLSLIGRGNIYVVGILCWGEN